MIGATDGRRAPGGDVAPRRLTLPAPEAISFDFGNTLVTFTHEQWHETLVICAARAGAIDSAFEAEAFIRLWAEERDRQFREDVPQGREADMRTRAVRVLARLRGEPPPPPERPWDDAAAGRRSAPGEVQAVLDAYVAAFLETTPVPPRIGPMLERLAARYPLALVSNWPLSAAIEAFLDAAGWRDAFSAVVVSQSAGYIKPQLGIFEAAARGLDVPAGPAILHVGDDIAADVGGAHAAGWRAALVRSRPADSPLPVAAPGGDMEPDLVLESVLDLEGALERLQPASGGP